MKHLLIILSFLLLSSPVIGDNHKGETLYRWENPSGDGWVWRGFGDKETHPLYKGQVKNGVPNGLGILIYPKGWLKYVGEFKDGQFHGHGTFTSIRGFKYVGEYKDGKKWNGKETGGSFVGEWKDGKKWNGTVSVFDGNITGKWVKPKKLWSIKSP